MAKKTIADVDIKGKRVLMRVDFNVPIEAGKVTDDTRIREALPSIKYVLDHGARSLVLMSHLGRPKGPQDKAKYSMKPAVDRLAQLLGKPVKLAPDVIGPEVKAMVDALAPGEVLMLENLRIHEAETKNGLDFARQIASYGDFYVNDAFGTSHRKHASMYAVPEIIGPGKRVAGFLVEKELKFLGEALAHPKKPFVAILGGAKVSDKIGVIEALIKKADEIIIGGAMANTFFLGRGQEVGSSLVEMDKVDEAKRLEAMAGPKMHLPVDCIVVSEVVENAPFEIIQGDIPEDKLAVDIGPKSRQRFAEVIGRAKTIFWNGPMGVFEKKPFDEGTVAIAKAVADATGKGAVSVIGGGDSAAAIAKAGLADKVSHISTGGGASLEFVEGLELPGVAILDDR
jgi:phosphoglycerate kinase